MGLYFCSNESPAEDPAELQRRERLRKQREKQLRFQQQQQLKRKVSTGRVREGTAEKTARKTAPLPALAAATAQEKGTVYARKKATFADFGSGKEKRSS
jgi:hypothetical protein